MRDEVKLPKISEIYAQDLTVYWAVQNKLYVVLSIDTEAVCRRMAFYEAQTLLMAIHNSHASIGYTRVSLHKYVFMTRGQSMFAETNLPLTELCRGCPLLRCSVQLPVVGDGEQKVIETFTSRSMKCVQLPCVYDIRS